MNDNSEPSSLERCRDLIRAMVREHDLDEAELSILARPLTPEEAIGAPGRRDFPVVEGKERVIEATLMGASGQAFTDTPTEFVGKMDDVLSLKLTSNQNRALFVATINAAARHLGLVRETIHCKDDDPERCAHQIARHMVDTGSQTVGLVGLNPAIAEFLVRELGPAAVRITDLSAKNIGTKRFGVEVWDGRSRWRDLVDCSEILLVTGTTLVNGTFDALHRTAVKAGRRFVVYGITAVAVCHLLNIPRLCPCAHE